MPERKKREGPLGLDMSFEEALERFAQTNTKEVKEGIERAKKKKPPSESSARRPARQKRERLVSASRHREDDDT